MALIRAFEATVAGPVAAADAIDELSRTVTGHIDAPSHAELSELSAALRLYYEQYAGRDGADRDSNTSATRGSHGRP
jgi:hypothetical protein